MNTLGRLSLEVAIEEWPRLRPLQITGFTFHVARVLVVTLRRDDKAGRGEAAGVYSRGQDVESMAAQLEAVRPAIETGLDRAALGELLPAGGARNAVDCALWDLEAKLLGRPAWQAAGLAAPRPLLTTFTCSAEAPGEMAAVARARPQARALKLKLTGEAVDADRVRAVREARPEVWLGIDANQGFTPDFLTRLMPVLVDCQVGLIEQPFPVGRDALLENFGSPIPVAADESLQGLADVPGLVGRFHAANIKLDKCGGLTGGLAMAHAARALGLKVMVGCMNGTSLAMAPAFVLGQLCDIVDLDAPAALRADRADPVRYVDGYMAAPEALWGHP